MGSDNTNRRTVETEFKKAMVRVNVPVGLLVTAFGIGPVSYTHLDVYKRQIIYK